MGAALTPLLDVADVARILNIRPRGVYLLAESGQLDHFKVGVRLRFEPAAVERYLAKRSRRSDEGAAL